jgi:hypothetical protein
MACLNKQAAHYFTIRLVQGAAECPDKNFHQLIELEDY